MRMGAIGRKPGKDVFLLLVRHGSFCGHVIGYTLQKNLMGTRRVEAKASIGPRLSIPTLDILVTMLPGNPHHA